MKNRQAGMDRLRILSAWFVVCIHLFALLGDLSTGTGISLFVNALVYALVFCAVNCFGLLSGWLGYREDGNSLRLKSLVLLWLQFVFYRVFFLLLPSLAGIAEMSLADVFLPVTRRVNWYMTAYFEMMLLAPGLNLIVRHVSRGMNAVICLALLALTVVSTALRAVMDCDPYLLGEGYNWMWLAALYFWGASLRKHGWFSGAPAGRLRLVLLASLLLTAAWRWGMRSFFSPDGFPGNTEKIFYSYTSPTIALASICLLLLHARLTGPGSRFIEKASSAALGVFLLHTTVWNWLIVPCAGLLCPLPRSFAWLNVLGSALVITLLCIPVDLLRGRLFTLLGIPSFAEKLHARFSALCGRIAEKVP